MKLQPVEITVPKSAEEAKALIEAELKRLAGEVREAVHRVIEHADARKHDRDWSPYEDQRFNELRMVEADARHRLDVMRHWYASALISFMPREIYVVTP